VEETRKIGWRSLALGFLATIGLFALALSLVNNFYFGRFDADLPRERAGKDGALLVLIPAGAFTMGDAAWEPDEAPKHEVALNAFYIDKLEITVARYARFLAATGHEAPFRWEQAKLDKDGDRPVVGVSWDDAQAYAQWVGRRLPTEAEWEKAARGTDGRTYPWGNEDPTERHAQFANPNETPKWHGYSTLALVGSHELGKSPYGVHDLAGNVSEWTADWFDSDYYARSPAANPKGPEVTVRNERSVRGGGWAANEHGMRTTIRAGCLPSRRLSDIGFRCAQDVP